MAPNPVSRTESEDLVTTTEALPRIPDTKSENKPNVTAELCPPPCPRPVCMLTVLPEMTACEDGAFRGDYVKIRL